MTNLTLDEIRNGRESTTLDFKQSLDLETPLGKSKLADDVVAFLNRGGGRLVIGVREKKGTFSEFVPVEIGDPDEFKLRLTAVIETGSTRRQWSRFPSSSMTQALRLWWTSQMGG